MEDIKYTTPNQQIEKLKSQNLVINDESFAKEALALCGYSNLIKSYREPYFITSETKKTYRSGVSFEQLYSLYILDKNLRNAVMASMLDLEEHIKELSADIIAKTFGTHHDHYLAFRNYSNKRKRKERFTLTGLLKTMHETLDTDKNPILHYKVNHGIVPPWILFKSIYFSTIINFIDQFKLPQRSELAKRLYNQKDLGLSDDSLNKLMMDTLFICSEYRNVAAHGGRIYNYVCNNTLRSEEIFDSKYKVDISGFSQLLFLLSLFNYQNPYHKLDLTLTEEVNRHCQHFPQDVTYLGQILNIDIIQRHIVYISENSSKYHTNPHCSGMSNSETIELEEAESQGYIPCKRCIR